MSVFKKISSTPPPSSGASSANAAAAATAADLLSRLTAGDSRSASAALVAPRNGKSVFVSTRNLAVNDTAVPVPSPMARSPSSPCFGGLLGARKHKGRMRLELPLSPVS